MAVGYFGKLLHGSSKASKSGRAINTVEIAKGSLKDRRKDFEDLGKRVSQYTQDPSMSEATKIELKKTIQPAAKKIAKLHDDKDKITKRNKGSQKLFEAAKGRKQFRSGGGTSLGMQSVKYGLDINPNITAADPKAKFIAKNKSKKNMKKVAKTPMDKAVRKA
jgi:hypothetical protein